MIFFNDRVQIFVKKMSQAEIDNITHSLHSNTHVIIIAYFYSLIVKNTQFAQN